MDTNEEERVKVGFGLREHPSESFYNIPPAYSLPSYCYEMMFKIASDDNLVSKSLNMYPGFRGKQLKLEEHILKQRQQDLQYWMHR